MRRRWIFAPGRFYKDKSGKVYECTGTRPSRGKVLLKTNEFTAAVALSESAMRNLLTPIKKKVCPECKTEIVDWQTKCADCTYQDKVSADEDRNA